MNAEDSRPAVVGQVEPSFRRLFPQREDERALLEAAAMAVNGGAWHPLTHDTPNGKWNPLLDDGDAFRMALALRISVWRDDDLMRVGTLLEAFRPDADVPAIARRLIVRAAAMCGKPPNAELTGRPARGGPVQR